jgi:Protein of unknown function (DUF3036).
MWTKSKSAALSLICTRVLIGAIIASAIILPFITNGFSRSFYGISPNAGILRDGMMESAIVAIYIIIYACLVPAIIALFSLDGLLRNIRKDIVFISANVKFLRIISWCCFAIAIILICGIPFFHEILFIGVAAAAFFGLLMRVVKNVIETACEIKVENDFTI